MLEQDSIDTRVLAIINDWNGEYQKYSSKDSSSAILRWLKDQGVSNPENIDMKNSDIVIAEKSSNKKLINGPAVIFYKDKTIYIGSLLNSQRSKFGFRSFGNIDLVYAGEYANDQKNGIGRLYSLNNQRWVFKGGYANDSRNGHGHLEKKDGGVYIGNYVNDKMEGKGEMKWVNGDYYIGSFMQDCKHGVGKMTWANGDKYEGEFLNNNMDGKGRYIWRNGEFFDGEFRDGVSYGNGTMDYTSSINIRGIVHEIKSARNVMFDVIKDKEEPFFQSQIAKNSVLSQNGSRVSNPGQNRNY